VPTTSPTGETPDLLSDSPADELMALSILDRPPPTGSPDELLALGNQYLENGDYATAVEAFMILLDHQETPTAAVVTNDQTAQAQLGLAVAYLREGEAADALGALTRLADSAPQIAGRYPETYFFLGQTYQLLEEQQNAIDAYTRYLAAVPEAAAYVNPLIAEAHLASSNSPGAIAAYQSALDGPAHRLTLIDIRRRLADLYVTTGDFAAAVDQYDAIREASVTEATKGEMTYLAGQAELQAGNQEAAYERFQEGIASYPRAYESYLGLVELVDAGLPVDEYQRGVVDYYAGAYQPAVEALLRYLAQDPVQPESDARLFLAWSYERLGNLEAALAELDRFATEDAARALWERAEMLNRAGQSADAMDAYLSYLETYPDGEQAAAAVWTAAGLAAGNGDTTAAIERYLLLAESYPWVENTPRALFLAGSLAQGNGDTAQAIEIWQRAAETYPQNEFGARSVVALLRLPEASLTDSAIDVPALMENLTPTNYYALRAQDILSGTLPYTAAGEMVIPADPNDGQAEAEAWLREQLAAEGEAAADSRSLSDLLPEIRDDPRRIVGETLWKLGLYEEAKRELEALRESYAGDMLASYQLALYFRDLGLYRSSIIAAASVLSAAGVSIYEAPLFLGRLSFPAYYADLVLPLAEHYGYDPRLQFALIRQESLFESFATSSAVAQGLSQVIPDTGAYIAGRLRWPDYENDDLYRPVVGLIFGAYYLDQQLQTFDNHIHAALSAYNGGPGNAARWYEQAGDDLDLYLDTVDFAETRLYIMRIYEGFRAYRYLYSEP
jgi:soluble lytic murein transglycosylase